MQEPETDPYAPPAAAPFPDSSPVRPRRVLVIAILFCAFGALVLGSMVWGLGKGRLDLNPLALTLPVGIGLLRGQTSSQWWATLWLILGYGLCGALMVAEWVWPGQTKIEGFGYRFEGGYSMPVLLACCAIPAAFLITLHVLLHSPKATAYFRAKRIQVLRERFRPSRGPRS